MAAMGGARGPVAMPNRWLIVDAHQLRCDRIVGNGAENAAQRRVIEDRVEGEE